MQEIEHEKEKEQEETAAKIKQLLADTIEFSQKTAMMAKRASVDGSASPERSGVIRNLVATPDSKSAKFGSPNVKGGAPTGPRFSNVVEHHEEEEEDQEYNAHLHFDSPDAQKNINDLRVAHRLLYRKSVEL
jgi:acylphosphatase